jgi:hypothetical protein
MGTAIEQVYTDRSNVITLILSEDGVPIADHTQFTRVVIKAGIDGALSTNLLYSVDSSINPAYFDLTQAANITLKLGEAGMPTGRYWCDLVVYTAQAPLGIVWEPKLEINVQ